MHFKIAAGLSLPLFLFLTNQASAQNGPPAAAPPPPCAPGLGSFDFEADLQGGWVDNYAALAFRNPVVDRTRALCGRSSARMEATFNSDGNVTVTHHRPHEVGQFMVKVGGPGGVRDLTGMTVEAGILVEGPSDVRPEALIFLVSDAKWVPGGAATLVPGRWTTLRHQFGEINANVEGESLRVNHTYKIAIFVQCLNCRPWQGAVNVDAIRWYAGGAGVAAPAPAAVPPQPAQYAPAPAQYAAAPAAPPPPAQYAPPPPAQYAPPPPAQYAPPPLAPAPTGGPPAGPPPAIAAPASPPPAQPVASTTRFAGSVFVGMAPAIRGLDYNAGIGVRAGFNFANNLYLGGALAVHQGDEVHFNWGATIGNAAGRQNYYTTPVVLGGDVGYRIRLPFGRFSPVVMPYGSLALIIMTMSSDGVFGESTIHPTFFTYGGGLSATVPLGDHYSVGVHSRTYTVTAAAFDFSDLPRGDGSFSTSIFYSAFYSELAYFW